MLSLNLINRISLRCYSTKEENKDNNTMTILNPILIRLKNAINLKYHKEPHPGLICNSIMFNKPYLSCSDTE
jgi:hypothetical protein